MHRFSNYVRIHLIYPCSDAISCPPAIGRKLREALNVIAPVTVHALDADYVITPGRGDILIGHPGWEPWHVFNRSVRQCGWARRIGIQPFCPGDPRLQAATDRVIGYCDVFLAICGAWWFARTEATIFTHWRPKLIHLDLAVDRRDFPPLKESFSAPGQRRFLYIGHSAWYKQPDYLCALARARVGQIAWIGKMRRRLRGPERLGVRDFANHEAQQDLKDFDFLLTVGNADANPTTILEAMAWGLVPVCTVQSGYAGMPGVINLPVDDVDAALAVLDRLQVMPDDALKAMQVENHRLLEQHFNWPRLCAQVVTAVSGNDCPALGAQSQAERLRMRLWELRSPNCWIRPRTIRHRLVHLLKKAYAGMIGQRNLPSRSVPLDG